ncbi:V/A-type H+-transporting ATPase subunit E [Dysgonomonadaceae bacterium PH5-43]|nr:V/A-type H+-transporting ATPase subunit E [Dysgonomonadaceae bacterium PH5-43]
MDNTIKELTEKIYFEGIEKGNEEANRIISKAHAEEQLIIKEAEEKALRIISDAEEKARNLQSNTKAELKLYGKQMVEALKTEIINLVNGEICKSSVKEAFADKEFIQKMILALVSNFAKEEKFVIETKETQEIKKYLELNTKDILDKKLVIEKVNGIKSGFVLKPKDGSYKISFGEDEFVNYFKELLRPHLIDLLFGGNNE